MAIFLKVGQDDFDSFLLLQSLINLVLSHYYILNEPILNKPMELSLIKSLGCGMLKFEISCF